MPTDLLTRIDDEVRGGLANERERLGDAARQLDFASARFKAYPSREPDSAYEPTRYRRSAPVMRRIVDILTGNLYRTGPARTVEDDPGATKFLARCYRACAADALWRAADRLSLAADFCAVQAVPTGDPDAPARLRLWDASQVIAWESADDPTELDAVGVVDRFDHRRRLRVWTPGAVVTWSTEKLPPGATSGGTAFRERTERPNPYGFLPFAFAHYDYPAVEFCTRGPGFGLAELNDYINYALTEGGDSIRYCARPILIARNVSATWKAPSVIRPGDVWQVPPGVLDEAGNGPGAELDPLQFDLGFIPASWEDLQAYLDLNLECAGVPKSAVRMEQSSARSGVAVIGEQMPLIGWAEGRQGDWARYEERAARLLLKVAAVELGANGLGGGRLMEAGASAPITLRWPDLQPDYPGQDRDDRDAWELDRGLTSKVQVLMRRRKLTRDEAIRALERVAEDREVERRLLPEPDPFAAFPADAQGDASTDLRDPTDPETDEDSSDAEGD